MSCFTITVLEPSGKIIQVESVAGTNISTTTLTNYSVPNIELSQCLTQLPSDFNDRIFAVVSGDIVASTGILISSSGGKIYLNSTLNSGNGISLSHDSGVYTITSTGLQPSGNYSLAGHQHAISDVSGLQIALDSKQPSGIYASGIHYHTISDITNFNNGVSGLLPSISGDGYITSSFVNNSYVISATGLQPSGNYSVVGHSHIIDDITGLQIALDAKQPSGIYASGIHNHISADIDDFNTGVSGLLPVVDIIGGTNIAINSSGSIYTVSVSGQLGLTAEEVDDRISNLLVAGTGITLNYNDNSDILTISTSGLQPSGNYSTVGHNHSSSDITDFNSSVSGLLPSIIGSGYVTSSFNNNNNIYSITVTGLQPSGNYSTVGHSHIISDISGLQIALDSKQPSGNYSVIGHTHISSDITDFNTSVSGLLTPYAQLNSPNFSGVPTVPTAASGTNTDQIASTAFVRTEITNLVDSAPAVLDTLNELAAALNDDPNFATTIASGLSQKSDIGHTHTSSDITNFNSSVSGLLPSVSGSGYVSSSFNNNIYTISVSGLQPSGDYSVNGHSHVSSDITDFNTAVSGLLPSISGIDGYLSKFTGTEDLNQSVIYQSGSNIGIGTTSPGKPLEISYNHPTDNRKTGGLRLTNPTSSSPSYLEFGVGGSAGYDRYGICSLNDVAVFRIRTAGSMEFASSFYSPANINWTNTNNANAYINLNNGAGVFRQSCLTSMEFQVSSSTIASLTSAGFATNTLRLGASATSGSIIGLSATGTVPAIVFDTVGNNHGFNQSLYEFKENGSTILWIDGLGNLTTANGNIIATSSSPATDTIGVFGGHGMRRRLDTVGMDFAWGGAMISTTDPGIDLFPIAGTHITNGILFRLSKNSTKTDVAMIVNGSGNVGIGTSTPSAKLNAYSTTSGEMVFNVEGTNGSLFSVIDSLSGSLMSVNNNAGLPIFEVFSDDSIVAGRFNQNDFVISSGGNIGIGTANPSGKLDVIGNVNVSGSFTMLSDVFTLSNNKTISASGDVGSKGNICWDSNYLYICVSDNNWKRISYDSW